MELLLFPFIVAMIVFVALVVVHEITYKGSWIRELWGNIKICFSKPGKTIVKSDERLSILKTIHETLEEIDFMLLSLKGQKFKDSHAEELKKLQENLLKSMEEVWRARGDISSDIKNNVKNLNTNIRRLVALVREK